MNRRQFIKQSVALGLGCYLSPFHHVLHASPANKKLLVLGLDGTQKMSKSYNNHIELAATPEETAKKIMTAMTDPARKFRKDPGHPEVCNVYRLQRYFTFSGLEELEEECRKADIGCVDCKKKLAQNINEALSPLRERRLKLAENPAYITEVMNDGAARARLIARETLAEVKEHMGLVRTLLQ